MLKSTGVLLSLILISFSSTGQNTGPVKPSKTLNKGKFYFYWGWNRGNFTPSDIHFKGVDYDFTLFNVVAADRQSKFKLNTYLNPVNATIPQYNARLGFNFSEHYSISIGDDHMKYVMKSKQAVRINGRIGLDDTTYNKNYSNEQIDVTPEFLQFEHTDGLNYINAEIRRFDEIYNLKKLLKRDIGFNITEGAGLGFLLPRTNTTLLGKQRYDEFHLAGYGICALVGLQVLFGKHFFIQNEWKGGFINMPDIRTTMYKTDKASQHFFFFQRNIVFGWVFK